MKILMVNKFLHPKGGSETYVFRLGKYLQSQGHEVQFFGMEHAERCVGNRVDSYTSEMDFHGGGVFSKLTYPVKTIYSSEARKKIRAVLDDFSPDVVHLNNFNFQLTPSIILEVKKWQKQTGRKCRIVYTAHDYQLVCPNHMCSNPISRENCEKCLSGRFTDCIRGRCIHGSLLRSVIGAAEAVYWNKNRVYRHIDAIICCSEFMKKRLDTNTLLAEKTVVLHNFIERVEWTGAEKKDYALYFGRFTEEKGVATLIRVCKELSGIQFVFAGAGPLEEEMLGVDNIKNVGFKSGEELEKLIREARFSICPSEWYENCPFSVMESQMYGTPVLGANIGGIPELIQVGMTGELFESGNINELKWQIKRFWDDKSLTMQYSRNCKSISFDTVGEYCEKLMRIYSI